MSLPSERIQPINLPGLVMMMQQMKNGQLQQQEHQFNLGRLYRADSEDQAFRDRLRANDMEGARNVSPTAYAKYIAAQTEQRKDQLAITKDEAGLTDTKNANTKELQQRLLAGLAQSQSPGAIANAKQLRDQAVKSGRYNHFDLPGEDSTDPFNSALPNPVTPDAIAQAQRFSGVEDPLAKFSEDEREFARSSGMKPGTQGWGPAFDAWKVRMKKAGATNVNVGGKTMPAPQVNELADFQTASDALDMLAESFKTNVPSEGVINQGVARAKGMIPNTAESQYNDTQLAAMQAVGLILENGKLVGQDEDKYRRMLPKPGDSAETAANKIASVKSLLSTKAQNRGGALGGAGYKVPKVEGQTAIGARRTVGNETRSWNGTAWVAE